jgi:hypothetical protein
MSIDYFPQLALFLSAALVRTPREPDEKQQTSECTLQFMALMK